MPDRRLITFLFACAFLCASTAAQEVTELGVIPTAPAPKATSPAKPFTGEQIFERTLPSIVFIETIRSNGRRAIGSGFIVSSDGLVITNAHVLNGAISVGVTLANDTRLSATSIPLTNDNLDLALLRLPPDKYSPVSLAQAKPRVGATVYAIGNPSGLSNTLSKGLLSGIRPGTAQEAYQNQSVAGEDASRTSDKQNFLLQHTASISSGSSGGVLLAETGEVIGVNTLFSWDAKDANFAVPSTNVLDVIRQGSDKTGAKLQKFQPSPPDPNFSLDLIDPRTARLLSDNIRNYACIGNQACNIQLLERSLELRNISPMTRDQNTEWEYYALKSTPLIISADNKSAWRSVQEALDDMGIKTATGTLMGTVGNDFLIQTPEGPILLLQCPHQFPDDKPAKFYFTPTGKTTISLAGKPVSVPIYIWNAGFAYLDAAQLGALLKRDRVRSLLNIKVSLTSIPVQRVITPTTINLANKPAR